MLFQSGLGLYSPLHKAVESFDFKAMPTKQLAQRIKNPPGIKQEELDDLGLFEWLEGVDGKVGKDQVLEFIKNGGPQIEEVVRGEDTGRTLN